MNAPVIVYGTSASGIGGSWMPRFFASEMDADDLERRIGDRPIAPLLELVELDRLADAARELSRGWTAPNWGTIAPLMGATSDALSSALFGKTRRNILGLLFAEPDKSFFLREITRRLGGGQGAAQRELRRLSDAGIIRRDGVGRMVMYRVNPDSPVYEELRGLIVKTAGAPEHLRRALAPIRDRVDVAFIYGSYARATGVRPASDIDLMVVGDTSFGEVVEHTAAVQDVLGREVNPTVYTRQEFGKRAHEGHHFIRDVLQHPKVFVIGGSRELDRLAEVRVADPPSTDTRRNSSPARSRRARSSR